MSSLVLALVSAVPVTNLEVAEEAVLMACQDLPSILYDSDVTRLSLSMQGDHDGNWLVEQSVTTVLSNAGIAVVNGDDMEGSGRVHVMEIRVMDLSIRYGPVHRSWFLGKRKVDRMATVEVSAVLLSTDGSVAFSERLSGELIDELSYGEVDQVSGTGATDSWLTPEVPESEGGGVLEPIIVTGVVASLIYLFYSSRAE
jgi:hypothetical protein